MKLLSIVAALVQGNTDIEAIKSTFESAIQEIIPIVRDSSQFAGLSEAVKSSTLEKLDEITAVASYWQDFLLTEEERVDCSTDSDSQEDEEYFGPVLSADDVCQSTADIYFALHKIIRNYACSEEKNGNIINAKAIQTDLFNKILRMNNKLGCSRRILYERL
ncbi:Oidioi.mRNA.OKI2018_I69.chr2.g6107.t1.cds [Oikopleura dioica]|uniref:Oidioi.mRNA.OKI2018_I69.chr2.g6107.t1.cds n=1 Tax=Oikopleura dioica TaxID=34765 RepID=A0ABN7T2K2_OIKDI|nr:Oidioi.mRNA.OKI2018_I69.chr2.g6107.t1.cds [Oikopleura dioica]